MNKTLLANEIFIIHALKGYEYHEARIKKIFNENDLHFEFITDGDPSQTNHEIIGNYFTPDIHRILSGGVLSCTLNHIYAYERIVSRQLEYALVFENDPFFLGNFKTDLIKYCNEIEKLPKGFIISLDNSSLRFPSYWKTKRGKLLYQAQTGRMAGAYLIDLEGAQRILNHLKTNKCDAVIDWWHNSLVEGGVIKMYWAHPPLIEQGSHNGILSPTISCKPGNRTRRIFWLFQKLYKNYFRRLFKEKSLF